MGWTFIENVSCEDIVRMIIAPEQNEVRHRETLHHSLVDDVLWSVVEITDKRNNQRERHIECHLLEANGRSYGYKGMCEAVHPFYYTCPLAYLAMAPVANADWRAKVKHYHRSAA